MNPTAEAPASGGRKLLIAEAANPEWVSVPLVGWSLASAIARATPAHIVTHVRNREAIDRAGLKEGRDYTAIDSDAVARPLWRIGQALRGGKGVGWTTSTAFGAVAYYYFERLLWQRFGDAIRRGEYDVVHRITPLSPTVPSLLAAKCRNAGVPFVVGPLNGGVPWPAGYDAARRIEREWLSYVRGAYRLLPGYRSMLESSAAIIAGSRDTLGQIPLQYRDKCIYIPENAIDPTRFAPAERRTPQLPLRACFVGRLVPYKGPDMLIESVSPLVESGRLLLDVFGDGPMMPELQTAVSQRGLQAGIRLHGWVEHRQLPELMGQSDLFLFPSIREFGGGVVLEAMALGLVPVVVDYAGPGELVTEGTGRKISIGPRERVIAEFRHVVSQLCDDPGQVVALGMAARRRVENLFTWDKKAEQVLQVYSWARQQVNDKPLFFND